MWYVIGMDAAMGMRICVIAWTLEGVEKDTWEASVSQAGKTVTCQLAMTFQLL